MLGSILKPDTGKVVWMLAGLFVAPTIIAKVRGS